MVFPFLNLRFPVTRSSPTVNVHASPLRIWILWRLFFLSFAPSPLLLAVLLVMELVEFGVTLLVPVDVPISRTRRGVDGALPLLEATWRRLARIPLIGAETAVVLQGWRSGCETSSLLITAVRTERVGTVTLAPKRVVSLSAISAQGSVVDGLGIFDALSWSFVGRCHFDGVCSTQ